MAWIGYKNILDSLVSSIVSTSEKTGTQAIDHCLKRNPHNTPVFIQNIVTFNNYAAQTSSILIPQL